MSLTEQFTITSYDAYNDSKVKQVGTAFFVPNYVHPHQLSNSTIEATMFNEKDTVSNGFHSSKGVTYDAKGSVTRCIFCDISARKEQSDTIVYETEEMVVFRTVRPYTDSHLLVVPRAHIHSVSKLKGEKDAQMVERMVEAGMQALERLLPGLSTTSTFCFHIPPFNSIDHLHLHAIGNSNTMTIDGHHKYSNSVYCWDSALTVQEIRAREK
jgi:diadenosine tetraphosphate (Ap4A) HIT family hydrolase